MLLINVARIDIPIAHAGRDPLAVKYLFILFCFFANFKLMATGIASEQAIIK
jgi:hypothetical protein